MKICLIFNPSARGDKARAFQSHLHRVAREAVLKRTACAGDARRLAEEAVREGFDTIVAAGGDGTLNEVLNGIGDAGGFERVRLGVLPLGTINVFARELGFSTSFEAVWPAIERGHERVIDLPWAEFLVEGRPQRRYFAQLAGAGLDSRAVELVNWELKKRVGFLAYVYAGLKAWRGPLPQVEISNGETTAAGQLVLIGNGRLYGGHFPIFPAADLCDGILEAVAFPRISVGSVARSCWGMVSGDFHTGANTIQLRGPRLELKSSARVPFQLDGENVASLPASFGLLPKALRVIVPESGAAR